MVRERPDLFRGASQTPAEFPPCDDRAFGVDASRGSGHLRERILGSLALARARAYLARVTVALYTSITLQPSIERLKTNAVGYNFGVDGTYFLSTQDRFRLGLGGFLRFTGATADFDVNGNTIETDAGGVQFAVGARLRF